MCCGKAWTWLSTLTKYPKVFDPEAAPDETAKAKTMKSLFLARWQLKGRTPQTLYMDWQNLKFDLAKDDIEYFCNDVKNLANRLGYPEDSQVMAIKATLPPVLVTQVINVTTFKEIRDTLITLVENPVIKRVLLTKGQVRREWHHLICPKCSRNQKMMWKCVIQMCDTCMEKKECSGL